MRFNAADFMDENARGIDATATQVMMDNGLDLGNQNRSALLDVPGEMEVDFGVIISGHGCSLKWLKPNRAKPRERGCQE